MSADPRTPGCIKICLAMKQLFQVTRSMRAGTVAAPRVTPFPEGMLRRVHEQHSGEGEGEFWRTSPRDRMVMGFRGPSPFGPVGTKIRAA